MPTKSVGKIQIDLVAGTVQFRQAMQEAKNTLDTVGKAAKKTISDNQAASASIRVLEGGLNNNLRAVETFMTKTLGLGPIMKAAFPLVGLVAFGELIVHTGIEVYNFFKKVEEGPARLTAAFREMNVTLRASFDELALSTEKILNQVAKLQGHPGANNLKVALDEMIVASDKLAESLQKNLDLLHKNLTEQSEGWVVSQFTGHGRTSEIAKRLYGKDSHSGPLGEALPMAQEQGRDALEALRDRLNKATTPDAKKAIQAEMATTEAAIRERIGTIFKGVIEGEQTELGKALHPTTTNVYGQAVPLAPDKTLAIGEAGAIRALNYMRSGAIEAFRHSDAEKTLDSAESSKAALALEEKNIKESYDAQLDEMGRYEEITAAKRAEFRDNELKEIRRYGEIRKHVFAELEHQIGEEANSARQTAFRESREKNLAEAKRTLDYELRQHAERKRKRSGYWTAKRTPPNRRMTFLSTR